MNSIELFSGGGGLAQGFHLAGFEHEYLLEYMPAACETLRTNIAKGLFSSVNKPQVYEVDVREFSCPVTSTQIDLLAGGPPCQPFSLGGKHQGPLDARDMFPHTRKFLAAYRPKLFLLENVKGLTRETFSLYVEFISLMLSFPEIPLEQDAPWQQQYIQLKKDSKNSASLRYKVKTQLLNALHYGVPQFRERFFFVGVRSDIDDEFFFPEPTHSINELLDQQLITGQYWDERNISPSSGDLDFIKKRRRGKQIGSNQTLQSNLLSLNPAVTMYDSLGSLPPLDLDPHENEEFQHHLRKGCRLYPGHSGSFYHLPSKTLKAGVHGVPGGENNVVFADGSCRYLSVREGARIQTFPDDYFFAGAWSVCFRQIGNGVPVALAEVLGTALKEFLLKNASARETIQPVESDLISGGSQRVAA